MTLSGDSIFALEQHYVGGLQLPSSLSLVPVAVPQVVLTSDAFCNGVLDMGSAVSPGAERRVVRVTPAGTGALTVALRECPRWTRVRWIGSDAAAVHLAGEPADLELIAAHDASGDRVLTGELVLELTDAAGVTRSLATRVRLHARCGEAEGVYDFSGAAEPRPHDFANGPYTLAFRNATAVPLEVSFSDLPAWLQVTVDGHTRGGPLRGRFFTRAAPFEAAIAPRRIPGAHASPLRIETNDRRPQYRSIELPLSALVEPLAPAVRVHATSPPGQAVVLENQGRTPARLSPGAADAAIVTGELPVIPPARGGRPGMATLPVRIRPDGLAPGTHTLFFSVRVFDGDPPEISIPVQVNVRPPRRPRIAAELALGTVAVLLLIVWMFVAIVSPAV
jgi:hypothetical protein